MNARKRKGGAHRHPIAIALREDRDGQADEWREAAARRGQPLAVWAREALDEAARASTDRPA